MATRDASAAAEEELRAVAAELPPAAHAFAYGSGAFPQRGLPGAAAAPPVLDFILAVEEPVAWHAEVCARAVVSDGSCSAAAPAPRRAPALARRLTASATASPPARRTCAATARTTRSSAR
jgi:hypothetical protein